MAATVRGAYNLYKFVSSDLADERSKGYLFVDSPMLVVGCLVAYNYFVLKLGPKLMANRQPFDLKRVIIVYDILQIALSGYIFYTGYMVGWGHRYLHHYICFPMDYADTPVNRERVRIIHLYFIVKMLDLLDTAFFVLRKKSSHVSFLHLYHHTGMVCISYAAAKWLPSGHGTFLGFNNCFVHVLMYSYYLAATLRPNSKYNIWWKKYITQLQMVQFGLNTLHQSMLLVQPNCNYPKFTLFFTLPQNIFMMFLFTDFYRRTYGTDKPKDKVE